MPRNGGEARGAPVLPNGVEPCIWMTARLVAYKLCDRAFDCDHCPFDAALRGGCHPPDAQRSAAVPPSACEYRSDRWYHARHGWVMLIANRVVRCGIDAFAAHLLGHVHSIVLPVPGTHVTQGAVACWCSDESNLYSLAAPVSGTVLRNNAQIRDEPDRLCSSPFGDGWLFELQTDDPLEGQKSLLSAEAMRAFVARQLGKLELTLSGGRRDVAPGPTLQDGGEPVGDLRKVLGPNRFRRLVRDWLG